MIGLKSITTKLLFSTGAYGLTMSRHNKKASESLLDMASFDQSDSIRKVALGGDWGSNPYPLANAADTQPLNIADGSSDQFFTDLSENGFRIRKELLDMHNYVRKLEAPAAKYMTKLIWDFHLEAYSREWARYLCDNPSPNFFDHSPDNQSGIPQWPYRMSTGENLYTSSAARPSTDDFSDVVKKWYDERADFNWSTGQSNDASKPIGHWKQLVRPQATTVGCTVIGNCHNSGWRTYVVCHYDYGNIGTLPYEPGSGESGLCKNCPSGFEGCCESGLCAGRSDLSSKSLAPYSPATQLTENWYGCATFKRDNCSGTGASKFIDSLPGTDLEYQQCSCGNDYRDFQDVVNNKLFYFRNRCYQGSEAGDDNSDVNNIYAMISLKSLHEKLFKDGKEDLPNPALEIEAGGGAGGGRSNLKGKASGKDKGVKKSGGEEKVKSLSSIKDSIVREFQGIGRRRQKEDLKELDFSVDKDSQVNMDVKAAEGLMMKLSQGTDGSPDSLKVSLHQEDKKTTKEAVKDLVVPPSLKTRADEIGLLKVAVPPADLGESTTTAAPAESTTQAPLRRLQASKPPTPSKSALAKPPAALNKTLEHEPLKLSMGSP